MKASEHVRGVWQWGVDSRLGGEESGTAVRASTEERCPRGYPTYVDVCGHASAQGEPPFGQTGRFGRLCIQLAKLRELGDADPLGFAVVNQEPVSYTHLTLPTKA